MLLQMIDAMAPNVRSTAWPNYFLDEHSATAARRN